MTVYTNSSSQTGAAEPLDGKSDQPHVRERFQLSVLDCHHGGSTTDGGPQFDETNSVGPILVRHFPLYWAVSTTRISRLFRIRYAG